VARDDQRRRRQSDRERDGRGGHQRAVNHVVGVEINPLSSEKAVVECLEGDERAPALADERHREPVVVS
jgi:hypothetical protein